MNKKECPKCGKWMVKWGGFNKETKSSCNIWKCGCGYEEAYEPNVPSGEELFKKKWKEANTAS